MQACDSKKRPPGKAADGKVIQAAHLFQGAGREPVAEEFAPPGTCCVARRKPASDHDLETLERFMQYELRDNWGFLLTDKPATENTDGKPTEFSRRFDEDAKTAIKRILAETFDDEKYIVAPKFRAYIDNLEKDIDAGIVRCELDLF